MTPSPWNETALYALLRFGKKNGGSWDGCGNDWENMPDEEDAHLIALAPRLLAELEHIVSILEASEGTINISEIKRVIDNAKGR